MCEKKDFFGWTGINLPILNISISIMDSKLSENLSFSGYLLGGIMKKYIIAIAITVSSSIATPFAHIDMTEYGSAIIPGVQPGVTWGNMLSGLWDILFPDPNSAEPYPQRDYQARMDARFAAWAGHAAELQIPEENNPMHANETIRNEIDQLFQAASIASIPTITTDLFITSEVYTQMIIAGQNTIEDQDYFYRPFETPKQHEYNPFNFVVGSYKPKKDFTATPLS